MKNSEDIAAKNPGIAAQEELARAFHVLAGAAKQQFSGGLGGKLVVGCGMGVTGGSFLLGAAMNGAAALGIDVDAEQIKRRVKTGYCDAMVNDLDESLRMLKNAVRKHEAVAVGLVANYVDLIPAMARRGIVPDLLVGATLDFDGVAALQALGTIPIEWKAKSSDGGHHAASNVAADYLKPLQSEGRLPVAIVAASGEPRDVRRVDALLLDLFRADEGLCRWVRAVSQRIRFEGLPARVCWLTPGERDELATAVDKLSADGQFRAPIMIDARSPSE